MAHRLKPRKRTLREVPTAPQPRVLHPHPPLRRAVERPYPAPPPPRPMAEAPAPSRRRWSAQSW